LDSCTSATQKIGKRVGVSLARSITVTRQHFRDIASAAINWIDQDQCVTDHSRVEVGFTYVRLAPGELPQLKAYSRCYHKPALMPKSNKEHAGP
ncbi:hypothetical protein, partial [Streptomyces sp. NRRL S-481]|uniref:hypothetical protein n=1 Tax=Streptomyces sp. NRRL S-481 TaxID=1463911 RepID=UPI001F29FD96